MAQEVERLPSNPKIGRSLPGSSSLYVEVSLGKVLNLELLPMAVPTVCECSPPFDEQVGTVW